jgi:molybdopterin converting factor small subunit
MIVRVQYMAQLRDAVGRADEVLEIPEGSSLGSLLVHLADRHGRDASPHLLAPDGKPQRSLLTVVNNLAVSPPSAGTTLLKPGDVVTLMPPIAGG